MPGDERVTVLGYPAADRLVIVVGIPGIAVLIGYLLPVLARWLLGLSRGLPFGPVLRFVGAADRPLEVAINLAIWLAIGVTVAVAGWTEAAKVTIADGEVRASRDNNVRAVPRAEVAAVFCDGPVLVVLDHRSRQRIRDKHQAPAKALQEAFTRHGYPWRDADPYADRFRRWLPGAADVPAATQALLTVRESLLRKKNERQATELREAAEALGVVVRDEGNTQYWRHLGTPV
jgi:hypothetical protein